MCLIENNAQLYFWNNIWQCTWNWLLRYKKILHLRFDSKYRIHNYSLNNVIGVIDKLLTPIKQPKFFHRMPRSVEDLVHWKSSELKIWHCYYALSILSQEMRLEYLEHFSKLVIGITALHADKITNEILAKWIF